MISRSLVLLSALGILLVCALTAPTMAQDEDPTDTPRFEPSDFFPPSTSLGPAWGRSDGYLTEVDEDVFESAGVTFYAGPRGSRAVLVAYVIRDGRLGIQRSWALAGELFDAYVLDDIDYEFGREAELEDVPLPKGCVDGRRTDGPDDSFAVSTVGITMCAYDSNVILIGVVTGQLLSFTQYRASDELIELAIASATRQTSSTPDLATPDIRRYPEPACVSVSLAVANGRDLTSVEVRTTTSANITDRAGIVHEVVSELVPGSELVITGPSVKKDLVTWYPVRWERTGEEGFVIGAFLEVCR